MQKVVHRADTRGQAEHGWLHSRHSFSFARYHNPERMGFGKLRVINDDVVEPGAGFPTHGHQNMEIISIPLAGSLRHKDSMGNIHVIRKGEVQIMSAGSGLTHSEYNNSDSEPVNFLQIWILPERMNIEPRYGQQTFDAVARRNRLQCIVAPMEQSPAHGAAITINQDAWLSLGSLGAGHNENYPLQDADHGLYIFVIDGEVRVADETLNRRDAIGLTETGTVAVETTADSELLLIEVPMR